MLGLDEFFQELESHCPKKAIATFLNSEGECFVVDLIREADAVKYGYDRHIKALLSQKISQGCTPYGSLILRSFTTEIDRLTRLPYKELRGYILKSIDDRLEFEKLSPEMLFACQNTDAETGEPLPLEQSVRYC
ncbi:hypothetical protein NIES2119_28265 [[Phormidium ambiguum] IAM M-71]|uniref:Uncharacterized protein n=1 Tax=[Phormidium ambiguum] IAM M-71 TaxID=454136 RepID=A0A1U7I5T3_9CYAN|nr:hypothetical protein [Phormidium ambiguum]OKH31626.1 hypothetical protein NIES2119_28265 [Phormidium ambiguum IAM M-71]